MYRIHPWCVLLQTAHSAIRSGVGFFCPVGFEVRPSYARRHVTAVCAWYDVRCKPYLFVRGTSSIKCPGWMTDYVPTRADECRLSARLHSRLVKESPPAQGWSTAYLDSLCDVPG